MTRTTQRERIAPGIYRDAYGISIIVTVKRTPHETRYALNTPLDELKVKQAEELAYWRRCAMDDVTAEPSKPERGTLAGDFARYLATRKGRASWKADTSHAAAWIKEHGRKPRALLKTPHVAKQISAWLQAGSSPKTIKHRVRVLKELWHFCDGKHRRTPADGLKLPRVPKTTPTPIGEAVIFRVAESLKAGLVTQRPCGPKRTIATVHHRPAEQCYARFVIRALTGQRPSQIGRARPEHIDRQNRVWWVNPGKGGNPVAFPLSDDLDVAFRYFDQVQAWGWFDTRSFSKTLKRHGWPKDRRPYALRHDFAIGRLLAGVDLGDLQGLLGHASPTTTRVYAPVLIARLQEAISKKPLKLVKGG